VSVPTSKREQQQNVCKVKPQQLQNTDDNLGTTPSYSNPHHASTSQRQQPSSSMPHQTSKFQQRYILPLDRQQLSQQSLRQAGLYTNDNIYGDLRGPQNLNFQSFNRTTHNNQPPSQPQDLLQQSLLFNNIYGTGPLQVSQNPQLLAWQVASTPNAVPTSSTGYQSQPSLFTTPTLSSSQLILQQHQQQRPPSVGNASVFSPQRASPHLQQQPNARMGLVINQHTTNPGQGLLGPHHHQSNIINMLQPDSMSRDHHAHSSSPLGHMSTSPAGQIPLLMEPSVLTNYPDLTPQQRSDLTKHVNAKPFEPTTSRTPPLMNSPPVVGHSVPIQGHQFSNISQALSGHGSNSTHQMMAHSQTNHHQPNAPLVASVRPRSIPTRPLTAPSPPLPGILAQDPLGTIPLDHNNYTVLANVLGYKTAAAMRHTNHAGNLQPNLQPAVPLPQAMAAARFTAPLLAASTPRAYPVRPTVHAMNRQQGNRPPGPGPIQRPTQIMAPVPQMPAPTRPLIQPHIQPPQGKVPPNVGSTQSGAFRNLEHQKMIEETKRYFQASLNPTVSSVKEEAPSDITPTGDASFPSSPDKEAADRQFIDANIRSTVPLPQRKR